MDTYIPLSTHISFGCASYYCAQQIVSTERLQTPYHAMVRLPELYHVGSAMHGERTKRVELMVVEAERPRSDSSVPVSRRLGGVRGHELGAYHVIHNESGTISRFQQSSTSTITTMATPPLSSDSSSTGSPTLSYSSPGQLSKSENTDNMAFDNAETLELLLQTITQNLDSPTNRSGNDEWSQLSSWTTTDSKSADMGSDFSFAFPMDLDFDSTMAVDPSALHFNTSMFSQPTMPENQYLLSSLPQGDDMMVSSMFSNDPALWTQTEARTGRRLSITSSSSSSGASLSPILEPQFTASSSPSSASSDCGDYSLNESDPTYELAQRVRETAGVTLAVPVSAHVQQLAAASTQPKVAIPRLAKPNAPPPLKRHNSTSSSAGVEASSSTSPVATPPSESEPSSAAQSPSPDPPVVIGVSGRPKTSHTTIERRYRTNLNARITGLKQAVPALRVLELKNGDASPYNDVIDTRGFVDGVKVARKMSKANVLGKATEYIRYVPCFVAFASAHPHIVYSRNAKRVSRKRKTD